jgi:hypothetical protein
MKELHSGTHMRIECNGIAFSGGVYGTYIGASFVACSFEHAKIHGTFITCSFASCTGLDFRHATLIACTVEGVEHA